MKRIGFKMKIKPGADDEYQRRHDEIWPELVALLASHGIRDYTIFYDPETRFLFAHHKCVPGGTLEAVEDHPLMRKWFAHMRDLMDTNEDGSPVMQPLREVFHMD